MQQHPCRLPSPQQVMSGAPSPRPGAIYRSLANDVLLHAYGGVHDPLIVAFQIITADYNVCMWRIDSFFSLNFFPTVIMITCHTKQQKRQQVFT